MSSLPGSYQSKLFNFLSQQSRKLAEKVQLATRQLKVAVVWGVQLLIYPIYALFQTSRLVRKQIQSSSVPESSPSPDQTADQPLLSPAELTKPISLPAEIFQETMSWEQNSQIAKLLNLFGESSLTITDQSALVKSAYHNLSISSTTRTLSTSHSNESEEFLEMKNQALIKAAIDYFFSDRNQPLINSSQSINNPVDEDPWLTETDLFGESVTAEKEETKSDGKLPNSLIITNYLTGTNNPPPIAALPQFIQPEIIAQPQSRQNQSNSQHEQANQKISQTTNNQIITQTPKLDSIETPATPIGYEKHLLEQILEWLDQGILFLEKLSLKLWQWIKTNWIKK